MNNYELHECAATLIAADACDDRRPRTLGASDGLLQICHQKILPAGFSKITKLSNVDCRTGCSSALWDIIEREILNLKNKGLLK